jgi:hypothetical protein
MRDDTLRRWSAAAVSSSALVAGCSRMRKGLSLGVSITQVYITQILIALVRVSLCWKIRVNTYKIVGLATSKAIYKLC